MGLFASLFQGPQNPSVPFAADYAAQNNVFAAEYAAQAANSSGVFSAEYAANANDPFAADYAAQAETSGSGAAAAQQFQNFGLTMQAAGMITQSIGAYYQAKMAQHEARSKASSMRFKAEMAGINASIARDNAGSIREAGQYAKAQLTMRAGMEMAKSLTRQGARGITMGVGSAAESMASEELIKDMDAFTVDSNTMRQAQAQEMQSVNLRNQGLLAGVSARNLERSASSISPSGAAFTSLIGGASRVGMNIGNVMAYRYGEA